MGQILKIHFIKAWQARLISVQEVFHGIAQSVRLPGAQAPAAQNVQRQAVPERVSAPAPQVAHLEDILKERDACGVRGLLLIADPALPTYSCTVPDEVQC